MIRYTLILTLAMLGCDSAGYEIPLPESPNPIDFSRLEVGQNSVYVRFMGEDYRDPDNSAFAYEEDRLVVTVEAEREDGFVFIETLTPDSPSKGSESSQVRDSVRYLVQVEGEVLRVRGLEENYHSSQLFSSYREDLPLAPIQENKVEIEGWKTTFPINAAYKTGYVENYTQLGREYRRLNVVVDDTPMTRDGPGRTFVYSVDIGVVRASSASAWTGQGWGWDLLP